jgi:histidyl-tRNA synthetase
MAKRNFILNQIKSTFSKFGFSQIETPTIENLSVLMGKYGDEGDQLLFKILNSGNFSEKLSSQDLDNGYKSLTPKISEKGLRYDLTVPFARFVVMNRNDLAMPFKRFQIQPVWRADKPQRGRYREFYQCDADVVGTNSLLCEAEIVLMLNEIFGNLKIENFSIKVNNRKILTAIAQKIGADGNEAKFCVAIDKLDKIGKTKVEDELLANGFEPQMIVDLQPIFEITGNFNEKLAKLEDWLSDIEMGRNGVAELKELGQLVKSFGLETPNLELDITLARGLSYYTGAIFEVKALGVNMGSISGGGRYDNLTGSFGMPGLSGVGISLGVDRIYDVMEELGLFPNNLGLSTQVMITNLGNETFQIALPLLTLLRANCISAEIYPDTSKLKKQFEYTNKRNIPFLIIIGTDELESGLLTIKNMNTGEQFKFDANELVAFVKSQVF